MLMNKNTITTTENTITISKKIVTANKNTVVTSKKLVITMNINKTAMPKTERVGYKFLVANCKVLFDFTLLFGVHHSNDVNTESPR